MDKRFALLLACFFLSGFAALLYQTVWSRELSFVFGTSDLAVAAVLAAYMGGLALGAAAAARFAHRVRRPVLVYGVLEGAIALCALAVPWAIQVLDGLYVAALGSRDVLSTGIPPIATVFQLAGAFAILLPPTAFMGATLPLLASHAVQRDEDISSRIGLLYAINTTGAIAGTLCAAFWLMPALGLRSTVWVGAGLNFVVFGLAAMLARSVSGAAKTPETPQALGTQAAGKAWWILPAIAVSGIVSFSYEVLWTRLLGHVLGASLQAFATMLASFLVGIALGSALAARTGRTRAQATLGFGLAQLGIAITSYAVFAFSDRLPELSLALGAGPRAPLASAAVAAAALLPITICIGATFPFAVRILARSPDQASGATARVYAWNTLGAIIGSLGTGFVLLPSIGFEGTQALGVGASLLLAAVAGLASSPRRNSLVAVAVLGGLLLVVFKPQTPWGMLATSAFSGRGEQVVDIAYSGVGRSATVVVAGRRGQYYVSTNGLPEASPDGRGFPVQVSLAHWLGALPAALRPEAREILVVGLGGGVALELLPSSYEKVHVIELEPEVLRANRHIASGRARDPLSDPRVQVHIGDARGTLQLARTQFDAIVSQPSHPWTAGASHLYTQEFFSLVRSRLAPDGVFVQWIGLQFIDQALLESLVAALRAVFPHVEIFQPRFHGLLFVGSAAPIDVVGSVQRLLATSPDALADLGIHSVEQFVSMWALGESGVDALIAGAQPNSDDHNFLATRSAALDKTRMTPKSLRELLSPHDPLRSVPELDFAALIRAMLTGGHGIARAREVAKGHGGVDEELAWGWIELGQGRNGKAVRRFERALDLDPTSSDALSGLIFSRRAVLARGDSVPEIDETQLDPVWAAVVACWRAQRREDWDEVMSHDAVLSGIGPGEALYGVATRLRILARLETGGVPEAREAMDLAGKLLRMRWIPNDGMLHARAALRAGDGEAAWGSIQVLANHTVNPRVAQSNKGKALAKRVMEIGRALPPQQYAVLKERLTGRREEPLPSELEGESPVTAASPDPATPGSL